MKKVCIILKDDITDIGSAFVKERREKHVLKKGSFASVAVARRSNQRWPGRGEEGCPWGRIGSLSCSGSFFLPRSGSFFLFHSGSLFLSLRITLSLPLGGFKDFASKDSPLCFFVFHLASPSSSERHSGIWFPSLIMKSSYQKQWQSPLTFGSSFIQTYCLQSLLHLVACVTSLWVLRGQIKSDRLGPIALDRLTGGAELVEGGALDSWLTLCAGSTECNLCRTRLHIKHNYEDGSAQSTFTKAIWDSFYEGRLKVFIDFAPANLTEPLFLSGPNDLITYCKLTDFVHCVEDKLQQNSLNTNFANDSGTQRSFSSGFNNATHSPLQTSSYDANAKPLYAHLQNHLVVGVSVDKMACIESEPRLLDIIVSLVVITRPFTPFYIDPSVLGFASSHLSGVKEPEPPFEDKHLRANAKIGCTDLVLEIFNIFFLAVWNDHHDSLINAMTSIMIKILNESKWSPVRALYVAFLLISLQSGHALAIRSLVNWAISMVLVLQPTLHFKWATGWDSKGRGWSLDTGLALTKREGGKTYFQEKSERTRNKKKNGIEKSRIKKGEEGRKRSKIKVHNSSRRIGKAPTTLGKLRGRSGNSYSSIRTSKRR
ncbi:hypothetical protein VNO77_19280 [Canavalia gladiata]|uniref:Uncharacterized protein n=1 Tax=Canavalia gladiata TaxID=3824 RepID=A0AAN9LMG9_CANGL